MSRVFGRRFIEDGADRGCSPLQLLPDTQNVFPVRSTTKGDTALGGTLRKTISDRPKLMRESSQLGGVWSVGAFPIAEAE